jgi:hypothetical protein
MPSVPEWIQFRLERRTRGAFCLCLALAVVCMGAFAPPSRAAPVAPPPSAGLASAASLQSEVCSIAKLAVKKGATKLISLFAERDIAVLSASILAPVSEKWCLQSNGLRKILDRVVGLRPDLENRIGPFVFGLGATQSPWNSYYEHVRLSWFDYDLTGRRRTAYLWQQLSGDAWRRIGSDRIVRHNAYVRFAVRVVNTDGLSSPWAYTGWYHIY